MVGIPDTKHLHEHILKHLGKKVLSGVSEDSGRCNGFFTAMLYRSDTNSLAIVPKHLQYFSEPD